MQPQSGRCFDCFVGDADETTKVPMILFQPVGEGRCFQMLASEREIQISYLVRPQPDNLLLENQGIANDANDCEGSSTGTSMSDLSRSKSMVSEVEEDHGSIDSEVKLSNKASEWRRKRHNDVEKTRRDKENQAISQLIEACKDGAEDEKKVSSMAKWEVLDFTVKYIKKLKEEKIREVPCCFCGSEFNKGDLESGKSEYEKSDALQHSSGDQVVDTEHHKVEWVKAASMVSEGGDGKFINNNGVISLGAKYKRKLEDLINRIGELEQENKRKNKKITELKDLLDRRNEQHGNMGIEYVKKINECGELKQLLDKRNQEFECLIKHMTSEQKHEIVEKDFFFESRSPKRLRLSDGCTISPTSSN